MSAAAARQDSVSFDAKDAGKSLAIDADWWRGAVIYQIYPRSFFDSNGDGIGDLPGITAKLDYVASLGVDAIWISPFFKSPMKDFGYDIEDYRAVDPIFGTNADFETLLKAAHERGLKVVVDLAISHTSDQHAWFKESRSSRDNAKADWYVWADAKPDGTPPNNWLSIFGGSAWTWDTRRCQYYMHNFLSCQPDLNIANPAVQDALLADLEFWLKLGVDGIRLDACNYYICNASLQDNPARPVDAIAGGDARPNNPYFWQWHIHDKSQPENLAFLGRVRALLNRYPGSFTVAEVGDDDQVARSAEYVAGDNRLHTAYSFALLGPSYSPGFIRNSLQEFRAHAGEEGWPSWSFSNHDVPRAVSRWARQSPSPDQAKLLIALLGALRGTVFMYQGEELGLPEAEIAFEDLQDPYGITFWPDFKGRDGCRTPMPWVAGQPNGGFSVGGASAGKPWLPVPAEHLPLAVDRQQADPASVLAFARAHLAWRRAQPALKTGTERFLDSAEPLLLVERKHPAQTILAAFNFENCTASAVLDLPDGAHVIRAHGARLEGRSAHFSPFGFLFLSLPQTEA